MKMGKIRKLYEKIKDYLTGGNFSIVDYTQELREDYYRPNNLIRGQ